MVPTIVVPKCIFRLHCLWWRIHVGWREHPARAKDAGNFFDNVLSPLLADFVEKQIRHDQVKMICWEFGVLRQTLRKIHGHAHISRLHMSVANHRPTNINAPDFRVRKAPLHGRRELSDGRSNLENTPHLPIFRNLRCFRHGHMCAVLGIVIDVSAPVRTGMIHMAGESIAHITARHRMNLVRGVFREKHSRIELERTRTHFIGAFHFR